MEESPPSTGAIVPINRRIVTWDQSTGLPTIADVPMFTKAQVSQIALAAASQLYVDPVDEDRVALGMKPSRFFGLTNLEVMLIKQAERAALTGEGVENILDRLIGKPKQTTETTKLTLTYEDKLKEIERQEHAKRTETIHEAVLVQPRSLEDEL